VQGVEWAILLGILTLACWMGAGVAAILGTDDELRHGNARKGTVFATLGLGGAGIACAIAMAAIMVVA